ncbi:uncharacterized protein LOC126733886 [Anthonomus grandis grandis]|uniref:uncharacterized protein LOC126733886 n=1 Tax=Anthonomus grandis grandis TaxID=2921223 RepID=UPI0021661B7F|nr:uncharacterized protein LOC126733886 [Anthonomus grandis grandis]
MLPSRTFFIPISWIAGLLCIVTGIPWIENTQEVLDTYHDIAVYNAVVESMNEWHKRQELRKAGNRTKREEPSVCYEKLGCFDASGPFGYLDMLPSKPDEINTKFLMYPARNRQRRSGSVPTEVPFEKMDEAFEWAKSGFNRSLPTKVLVHGFGSDCGYIWAYEIRSALMAVEEVNTICVDWSNGAALPNYVKASANTRLVGKQVSLLLRGLVEKNGLSLLNTHLIGFSLGAHIAGFAGADLGNLSRITGLDPAGPLFESQDTRARLDETDAGFVDVIHSNGENLILGGLGSSQPMGHVDFYPNGGRMQKGCSHLFVGAVSDIIWSPAVEGRSLCNHRRATKFFIDSVSPRCHFPAFPCDTYDNFLAGKCFPCSGDSKCGNMGYYADRSKGRGQLYLITREEEPFCAHQYLVRIETSPSPLPVKSYGKIQVTLVGDSYLNESFLLTRKEDEELKLGEPVSKIVVLHPLLSQPIKIEVLYTAYSGWLSSGLSQWKIDKVMLMDSFGKISSVCKKNFILESGKPAILPLYPRDCDIHKTDSSDSEEEIKLDKAENVHVGYLNSKEESTNSLDDVEAESSRAFNSRVIKADKINKNTDALNREVVEPILKPQPTKNGRAHVESSKSKSEISEPILGPTTVKSVDKSTEKTIKREEELLKGEDRPGDTRRKPEDSKSLRDPAVGYERSRNPSNNPNPLDAIVTTVQFLPQRLARMFEQAEKYARETFLPLVSTYTPRFISDFIGQRGEPKYVPLHYEEDQEIQKTAESKSPDAPSNIQQRSISIANGFNRLSTDEVLTTPYTHIQRIIKKSQKSNNDVLDDSVPSESSNVAVITESVTLTTTFSDINPIFPDPNKRFNIRVDYGQNGKNKRQNQENSITGSSKPGPEPTLIETVANVLQNIPDSFSRALNQFQNYTRSNILPFVQSYSPRSFADLLWIRPAPKTTLNIETKQENSSEMTQRTTRVRFTLEQIDPPENVNKTSKIVTGPNDVLKTTSKIQTTTTSSNTAADISSTLSTPSKVETFTKMTGSDHPTIATSLPTVTTTLFKEFSTYSTSSNLEASSKTTDSNQPTTDSSLPTVVSTVADAPIELTDVNHDTTTLSYSTEATTLVVEDSSTYSTSSIIKASSETTDSNQPTIAPSLSTVVSTLASTSSTVKTSDVSPATSPSLSTVVDEKVGAPYSTETPSVTGETSEEYDSMQNEILKPYRNSPVIKILTTKSPVSKKTNYIQRIPKRGEQWLYTLPQPFTIVIDPRDLTTEVQKAISTTTTVRPKVTKYQSYIQKIPKKKIVQNFKFLKKDPWEGMMVVGQKDLLVQSPHGDNMILRVSNDGRFIV